MTDAKGAHLMHVFWVCVYDKVMHWPGWDTALCREQKLAVSGGKASGIVTCWVMIH